MQLRLGSDSWEVALVGRSLLIGRGCLFKMETSRPLNVVGSVRTSIQKQMPGQFKVGTDLAIVLGSLKTLTQVLMKKKTQIRVLATARQNVGVLDSSNDD